MPVEYYGDDTPEIGLSLHFIIFGVVYTPRSCNKCAHDLARSGLDRTRISQAFGLIPSQILYLVLWVAILLSRWVNKARASIIFKKKHVN